MRAITPQLEGQLEVAFDFIKRVASWPLVQVITVFAVFRVTWVWFYVVSILPEDSYREPSLFLAVSESPFLAAFIAANLCLFAVFRKRTSWEAIDSSGCTRMFVLVPVLLLTLQFATADINFYYDQLHVSDRILVLVLAGLIYVHPIFASLWFSLVMVLAGQLAHPLQESEWLWADKRLILDFLILFHCFLYVRVVMPGKASVLLFATLILTGSSYFFAGQTKMMLGPSWYSWMEHDQLSNIVVAAYNNGGWLRPLGDTGIVNYAQSVATIERPLGVATLAIELAGALLLFNRRLTAVVLVSFVLMHVGILATTGIFFWKWSLFDLALLVYLFQYWRRNPAEVDELNGPNNLLLPLRRKWALLETFTQRLNPIARKMFVRPSLALALTLVAVSPQAIGLPSGFGWYDSPISNYFVMRGVGESGEKYTITPRFFAPYDLLITQSRFYFLIPYPVLAGTYGTVHDHRLAKALREGTLQDVPAIRKQFGRNQFDPERARAFAKFVGKFVNNAQQRKSHRIPVLGWIAPPYHFQTFAPEDEFDFQEKLVAVEIVYHEDYFDGSEIHKVLARLALRVDLNRLPLEEKDPPQ